MTTRKQLLLLIGVLSLTGSSETLIADTPFPHSLRLRELKSIKGPSAVVSTVRYADSTSRFAAGFFNNQVHVWSDTNESPIELQGHDNWVTTLAWSPHSNLLASAGLDKKILIWSLPTDKPILQLAGHDQWIRALAVSSSGNLLASGGDDNLVKIWNLPHHFQSPLGTVQRQQDQPSTDKPRLTLRGHRDWVWALAFSPDTDLLASGSLDGTVRLWHATDGRASHTLKVPALGKSDTRRNSAVRSLAFGPYGKVVAAGCSDRTIRVWNAPSGKPLASLLGHQDEVLGLAFHPNGRFIASSSADKTIRLWDILTGELLQILTAHSQWVWSVDFSKDGSYLVSAGADETVRIWTWTQP